MSQNLTSMTGFARASGRLESLSWVWEARSVNGKGLDIRLRLPTGYEQIDQPVRQSVKKAFARGSVTLQLTVEAEDGEAAWRINEDLVAQLREFARKVDGAAASSLRFSDMLAVRGIVEQAAAQESDHDAVVAAVLKSADQVLSDLASARGEEGARLSPVLNEQLSRIDAIVTEVRDIAGNQPERIRERLNNQLAAIMEEAPSLPEERLTQEVAILATRADITEEMDRLDAHISQARDLLSGSDPAGRRLDFLCQELNREANTICSKSTELAQTRAGMELKALIEQFREQIQNIE